MNGPERSAGPRSHDVLRHKQGGEAEEPDQEISFEGSIEDKPADGQIGNTGHAIWTAGNLAQLPEEDPHDQAKSQGSHGEIVASKPEDGKAYEKPVAAAAISIASQGLTLYVLLRTAEK